MAVKPQIVSPVGIDPYKHMQEGCYDFVEDYYGERSTFFFANGINDERYPIAKKFCETRQFKNKDFQNAYPYAIELSRCVDPNANQDVQCTDEEKERAYKNALNPFFLYDADSFFSDILNEKNVQTKDDDTVEKTMPNSNIKTYAIAAVLGVFVLAGLLYFTKK